MCVYLVSKISNLCDHNPPTSQTDRQTDGRTDDMRSQYRTTHYSASHGNKTVQIPMVILNIESVPVDLVSFPLHIIHSNSKLGRGRLGRGGNTGNRIMDSLQTICSHRTCSFNLKNIYQNRFRPMFHPPRTPLSLDELDAPSALPIGGDGTFPILVCN